MRHISLLLLTLFFIAISCKTIHAQTWTTIGSAGFSIGQEQSNSIAIDKNGTPYVVYQDITNGMKATVKKYNGSSWVTVGGGPCSDSEADYTSIAIDTAGIPYVVYVDYAHNYFATVMKFNGTSWIAVGGAGFSIGAAWTPSIAIDKSGTPYVAYCETPAGLGYAGSGPVTVMKYSSGSWGAVGSTEFSAGTALFTSIAIDTGGVPFVAYMDYINSQYATVMKFDGSSWTSVGSPGFSGSTAAFISLAIDKNDIPYVAYSGDGPDPGPVTVWKFNGTTWVTVGTSGFSGVNASYTSIAINNCGTPYVAYEPLSGPPFGAVVMTFDGTDWVNAGSGSLSATWAHNTSITIDNTGSPVVTYSDGGTAIAGQATVMKMKINPILGVTNVCEGLATELSDPTAGGVWSSSNLSIATIGSITGVVTSSVSGTDTINYEAFCITTFIVVTVNPAPLVIIGTTDACAGTTIALSDATTGGTWSIGTIAHATVGLSSGLVTGVAAGTSNITYKLSSTGCETTTIVTIDPSPSAITGTTRMCNGSGTTLSDATTGGTWSSGTSGVAIIGSLGDVASVSLGTAIISYTLATGCGITTVVTVEALPLPALLSGSSSVCVGAATPFTASVSGGTWSSANSNATANITTGNITGIAAGVDTVIYTVTNACGDTTTSKVVTINPLPASISGSLNVCIGATTSLNDASTSGTWSSGSTGTATVGFASGTVTGIAAGAATITYTLPTGCITTAAVTVINCSLGVSQASGGSEVNIFPNPNKGEFTVRGTIATVGNETEFIEIANMLGQVIYKSKITVINGEINTQVSLSKTLASGMYILNLVGSDGSKVFHFEID